MIRIECDGHATEYLIPPDTHYVSLTAYRAYKVVTGDYCLGCFATWLTTQVNTSEPPTDVEWHQQITAARIPTFPGAYTQPRPIPTDETGH